MIKRSIQQEDITLVNIYAPNIGALKYIKQILTDTKGAIDSNTVMVGDFNTPLTSRDKPSRQKVNKETAALNDRSDQRDLIDILEHFPPKQQNMHFFSIAHGTFFKTDHTLGHKTSLKKFKKTEIMPSIFSDYNGMTLLSLIHI